MKQLTAPIDQAGRIVLPKQVREDLAISPGDVFKVSVSGTTVTLTPSRPNGGFIRKGRALVFSTGSGATLGNDVVQRVLEEERGGTRARAEAGLRGKKRPA